MNFVVVGAGAIGGVIGGYLARAGHRVLFVDKDPDHVRALREQGLSIRTASETFTIPVDALSSDAFAAEATPLDDVDAVLLAVKAQHTEDAVTSFSHRLPETACVVNGLCEGVIARYVEPERTVGAFVNLFADCVEPGVVEYGGVGSLFIGELDGQITPRLRQLQTALQAWGDARITGNIHGYLWSKLAYGAVLTVTALTNETMADVMEPAENRPLLFALAREVLAVAKALGIECMPFDDWEPALVYPGADEEALDASWERLILRLRSYTKVRSGIWRDMAVRGRKTEVPWHLGPVIQEGRRLGHEMRLTERLLDMIREAETGQRPLSLTNLEELNDTRRRQAERCQPCWA